MANNYGAPVSFNHAPDLKLSRSKFDLSYFVNTGGNAGYLYPLGKPIEVLPGDTFSIDLGHLTRMTPTINVPLENIYLDVYFFYVPNRIVWSHWEEFISTENKQGPWIPTATYSIPQITLNSSYSSISYIMTRSVLSFMGLPTCWYPDDGTNNTASINALPVRGFAMIWNQYFMDEFTQSPILINTGDTAVSFTPPYMDASHPDAFLISTPTGGDCPPVAKLPDLFTTCKPAPQKFDAVTIPDSPVIPISTENDTSLFDYNTGMKLGYKASSSANSWSRSASDKANLITGTNGSFGESSSTSNSMQHSNLVFTNLQALGPTVEQLRIALLTQAFYERLMTGGSRYREYINSFFGVVTPDASVQIPEYLGGKTFKINVSPVVQTSESNNTPQGHVSGYSSSYGSASMFTKSFTEHGYIIPVYTIRYKHSYSQGIDKMWTKKSMLDFYNPIFANIGYQPVKTIELYSGQIVPAGATGSAVRVASDRVFGYQEAWYDYRYTRDQNVGYMRLGNLSDRYGDSWSLGDIYGAIPTLSSSWIREDPNNLNRLLAVSGTDTVPQFISNFYFKVTAVRRMPMYSIPGLGLRF